MKCVSTVHGVMLEVDGDGLLITGPAGIGKSDLALCLVCSGHRLVADDAVELHRRGDHLIARSDPRFTGFLALRDLGIVNLSRIYGAAACTDRQKLDLILELRRRDAQTMREARDLRGRRGIQRILDVEVPRIQLLCDDGRPLAQLAEAAVRDQRARNRGYRADCDFETRLNRQIEGVAKWS